MSSFIRELFACCVCLYKGFLCAMKWFPLQCTLPVVSHQVFSLWTYTFLHLLWTQEAYQCMQSATLRRFGSQDISPLCILSKLSLQVLFSRHWYPSHPSAVLLGTLLPDIMFYSGCHPAGSLPPFQLGCDKASWHQEYLPSFSTHLPSPSFL